VVTPHDFKASNIKPEIKQSLPGCLYMSALGAVLGGSSLCFQIFYFSKKAGKFTNNSSKVYVPLIPVNFYLLYLNITYYYAI
jgi:hypothetical protein